MPRQEQKVELTGRFAATLPDGQAVVVTEHTEWMRLQEWAGTWTPWLPGARQFRLGKIPLNLLEDGDWETAEHAPRRVTRQR